jgi:hypothetical protein
MSTENLEKDFDELFNNSLITTSFPNDSNIITKIIDVVQFEHNVSKCFQFFRKGLNNNYFMSFKVKNPLFEEYTDELLKRFSNASRYDLDEKKNSKENLFIFDLNSNSKLDDQKTSLETSLIDEDLIIDEDNSQSINTKFFISYF